MADDWDRILETFKPPWKIKRHESCNYWIEDEEALTIVKAIAKMSKRK